MRIYRKMARTCCWCQPGQPISWKKKKKKKKRKKKKPEQPIRAHRKGNGHKKTTKEMRTYWKTYN